MQRCFNKIIDIGVRDLIAKWVKMKYVADVLKIINANA